MEKELIRYKKTLKKQNAIFAAGIALAVVLIILSGLEIVVPTGATGHWADLWNGFIAGLCGSFGTFMLLGLVLNLRCMRDEKKLKQQYIKAHDERAWQIAYRSGHASYWFDTLGLLLGAIISGYFSPMAAIVCLVCLLYICFVRFGLKLYYNAKL